MERCLVCALMLVACGSDPAAQGAGGGGNGGSGVAGSAGTAGGAGGAAAGASAGGSAGSSAGSGGAAGTAGAGGSSAGAGTGGGGTGGSGGTDGFFGASRCTPDFDLCEDFEAAELDTQRWEVQGSAPAIDAARAARGSQSAHFHTEDNGLSLIRETETFPAANNTYWARIFVYFDAMPTAPQWAHWTISGAVGTGTDAEIRVGGQYDGETNRFGVGTDGGPTGDWTNLDEDPEDAPLPVPEDEWICVEWLHQGDTDETRFFWDGVEHESLYTSSSEHGGSQGSPYLLPEFEAVWFGWWLYQAGTTPAEFDVWIDEIAIDGERIGCTL